jgi:dolichol-phosphate mannosyltransferase
MNSKTISVVIPCYNEEEVIPRLIERITIVADCFGYPWEVICVDDCSVDRTWELLRDQTLRDSRWRAISFARNFGHQTAVSSGIYHASGDAIVIMDADLQDPPEEIPRFISKWEDGYDVVYAIREKRKEGVLKRLSYYLFYRLISFLSTVELPLDSGDFCLMDRKVVDVLKMMPERNRFVRGLRSWAGFKQIGLPYERCSRAAGEPKYTFVKLLKLAMDGIVSFSSIPLRIASLLGFGLSLVSLAGILFTLFQRIFSSFFAKIGLGPVPGFATIVISNLFLGGVQLVCLGIIGEYLGRIYDEIKQRPQWVIKDSAGITPIIPR